MTGAELATFITGLNGGATIDVGLLNVLVNTARTIIEKERNWMVLRPVDTSKTVTTANTWQTAISLSTITNFVGFYNDTPVRLFDGVNRIERYLLKPFDRRLEYKDVSNTCVYDEVNKILYLNGVVPFSGTLYINYKSKSTSIDVESASTVWTQFDSDFTAILGFYAIGIHMGGVDYDTITARQAPANFAIMTTLKRAMEKWDEDKAAATLETNDPTDWYPFPRSGAIDRSNDQT